MKIRDSGMPNETYWDSFFDVETILDRLGVQDLTDGIVDLGCGYGSFTAVAASRTTGTVYAFDIEPVMVRETRAKVRRLDLENVVVRQRDVLTEGTGLETASCSYVMAFNILHAKEPQAMLAEAWCILARGGRIGIIHWIPDPTTPRGPDLSIRPRPEQCQDWLRKGRFVLDIPYVSLPPYHYGVVGRKV
jgi:SAM-dependent methyltransferase